MKKETSKFRHLSVLFMILAVSFCLGCLAAPKKVSAEPKAYDLIIPEYDSEYLTDEELDQMPLQVLCYGKNEIYAQHGRKFLSKELNEYFQEQVWYYGTIEPSDFSESVFNEYETANIQALTKKEKERQEGGYQLDQPGYSFQPVYDYINNRCYSGISEGFFYNENTGVLTTMALLLCIPDSWTGGWGYDLHEDSISLYCNAVRMNSEMYGTLCTIFRSEEYVEESYYPHADYLGESEGYYYYVMYPTDVQFDNASARAYQTMYEDVDTLVSSIYLF